MGLFEGRELDPAKLPKRQVRRNQPAPIVVCEHEGAKPGGACKCPCVACFASVLAIGSRCLCEHCTAHRPPPRRASLTR